MNTTNAHTLPDKKVKLLEKLLKIMEKEAKKRGAPVLRKDLKNPFQVAIFAILSTRTKDEKTIEVCRKLFKKIKTVEDLKDVDVKELEKTLYGVGFYKKKTKVLKLFAKEVIEKFGGKIPSKREDLLSLPGIGPKVANVILNEAFGKPFVAVDVHVHRISNRLGLVKTKTPKETEKALNNLPEGLKKKLNVVFVAYGQTVCKSKPLCEECKIKDYCDWWKNGKNKGSSV